MLRRFNSILTSYPRLSLFLAAFISRAALSLAIGPQADADPPLLDMARNILKGLGPIWADQGITVYSWLPPAFSYLMAPYLLVFGENLEPLRWVLILWSSWACVQLAELGEANLGPRGRWAGWIWALYPPQIFWSSRANPFTIGTNLLVFLIWLSCRHPGENRGPGSKRAWIPASAGMTALIGLLWALLTLTRSEYILMFACLALYFFLADGKKLKRVLIASLFFALGMSPWVIRNWRIFHQFVPVTTNSGLIFWYTFHDTYKFGGDMQALPPDLAPAPRGENEVQMGKRISGVALDYIKQHPKRALYIWVGNLLHFWRPYLSANARDVSLKRNLVYVFSWVPVFLLFLLGLSRYPWREPFWILILSLILCKWFSHSAFYMIVHFREMIAPLIILIATLGLTRLMEPTKHA